MEALALHSAELKPAISPNVGDSGAQFLVEGDCVRASPVQVLMKQKCLGTRVLMPRVAVQCSEPGLCNELFLYVLCNNYD